MPDVVAYPLSNGGVTLIDAEDLPKIKGHKWYQHMGYARARVAHGELHMSHMIMPCPDGMFIDHINRNKLDNRKANLRVVTRSQNNANRSSFKNSTSVYKGVHWNKKSGLWEATIKKDGHQISLGMFDNEVAAASAYNANARKIWGEYAVLNDIEEVDYRKLRCFKKSANPQSRYLGVTKHSCGKWTARLTVDGKRKTLGYFTREEDAAKAYNDAYVFYTGKEAPNVIEEKTELND